MRKLIPFRAAAKALLVLFALALVFQTTVLLGLVPTEMVWGGRLQDEQQRTTGALVSMAVLVLAMVLVLMRMGRIGSGKPELGRWGMWALTALFALNTVGNLLAMDPREAAIFTPITAVLAMLAWRVALGEE